MSPAFLFEYKTAANHALYFGTYPTEFNTKPKKDPS